MLTKRQVAHFRAFGFVVLRGLFSPDEMADISRHFDDVMAEEMDRAPFSRRKSKTVLWFLERRPYLTGLAEDDRVYNVVEQLLGTRPFWVLSDGSLYVGDTQWHGGDGKAPVLDHVKVVIYPDPLTRDNGCLRVIPGSHLLEYQRHLNVLREQFDDPSIRPFGVTGAEVPAYPLESQPGDVVFASENLWHASFGGAVGRRMFNMNYYENPESPEQIEYVRDEGRVSTAMFNPHEAFLNSERPRIRGMVQRYVELGLDSG